MSKEKQIEEMTCDNCIHYNYCLEAFRSSKAEGLYDDCTEEEYFSYTEECTYYADKHIYRKQIVGEWKDGKCSVCGSKMPIKDDGKGFRWHISDYKANYCPNCGAKMKGGE